MIYSSLFKRIKAERKRLKLTQATAASLTGIQRETWNRYESGALSPGMEVLAALAKAGADIHFILTGEKIFGTVLSKDELELINIYRNAPLNVKVAAIAALHAGSSATTPATQNTQIFKGKIKGQFAGNSIINNTSTPNKKSGYREE